MLLTPAHTSLSNPSTRLEGLTTLPSISRKQVGTAEQSSSKNTFLSGVASFAFSMQLDSLNYNRSETKLVYRTDNSLSIRASSTTNINLKSELYRFDIALTAESLGLSKSNFADPGQPMVIALNYSQSQMSISRKVSINEVKTLRTPLEIIQDLVEGITTAMQDPNNKSISYKLDAEAISSLIQSDPKMAKLFGELVMIMNAVNLMKKQNQESNDYVILLSGKGKPYTDIKEEVEGEGFVSEYQVKITILAPQSDSDVTDSGISEPDRITELLQLPAK